MTRMIPGILSRRTLCALFTFATALGFICLHISIQSLFSPDIRSQTEFYHVSNQYFRVVEKRSHIFVDGRIIYQTPLGTLRGIVFIAHACSHGAYDFWPSSPLCEHCTGLSEEVRIVQTVVKAGYIAVAINSSDRNWKCWSNAEDNVHFVADSLLSIQKQHGAINMPIFAIGTSSGANFVWGMACRHEVSGAILQVLAVDVGTYATSSERTVPIVLNPMRRDVGTYRAMERNYEDMQKFLSVEFVKFKECKPIPLTVPYLMGRLNFMDDVVATRIVTALRDAGHINISTGYLAVDPTSSNSNWREVVQTATKGIAMKSPLNFAIGKSPLAKTLNRAWEFHEYCADYIAEDLQWMNKLVLPYFQRREKVVD